MATFVLPRSARAHTPGLSTANFVVRPGGEVEARLTFASVDVDVARSDPRGFLLDGVDVAGDGERCAGTFVAASPTEVDGFTIDGRYDCPADVARVEVTLYYLNNLPRGHREVARIVADSETVEAVLSGTHRALALSLPWRRPAPSAAQRRGRHLLVLTATFAAAMLALFVWRWRATRRRIAPHGK